MILRWREDALHKGLPQNVGLVHDCIPALMARGARCDTQSHNPTLGATVRVVNEGCKTMPLKACSGAELVGEWALSFHRPHRVHLELLVSFVPNSP